jgi:hypothetical protein
LPINGEALYRLDVETFKEAFGLDDGCFVYEDVQYGRYGKFGVVSRSIIDPYEYISELLTTNSLRERVTVRGLWPEGLCFKPVGPMVAGSIG